MTEQELIDAVDSQVNRYNAIQAILDDYCAKGTPFLCTMLEDAAEFGIHLMKDWCAVENEADNTTS